MYCINCGVELADTEKVCPLCNTAVMHSVLKQPNVRPLYPKGSKTKLQKNSKTFHGILVMLFLLPMIICFFSDLQADGNLNWVGLVVGGLAVAYITFALPLWFRRANPVIFVPCDFAAAILFLLYINFWTDGNWFLSFALPISVAFGLITCAIVTLNHYLHNGKLYIFGGGSIAYGVLMILIEFLLTITFDISFSGWSIYPLVALVMLGLILIYLAINSVARETIERKLFF